jgi:hypothetical protein
MKVIYLAAPLGSGPEREFNRANAASWVAWAASRGVAPIATWQQLSGIWPETLENREKGLALDCALVERCDEVWLVGGRISPGMAIEAEHGRAHGVVIVDLTHLGPIPPEAK